MALTSDMRKFLKQFGWFGLLWIGIFTLLSVVPIDPQYSYTRLDQGCRSGAWIYHQIFETQDTFDVVIVGSSHSMCALDDSLWEALDLAAGTPHRVVNMGTCFYGRDLQFYLIRDLLQRHRVRHLVLEVRTDEKIYPHPRAPWFATGGDGFRVPFLTPKYFLQWGVGIEHRMHYWRDCLHGEWPIQDTTSFGAHAFVKPPPHLVLSADWAHKPTKPLVTPSEGKLEKWSEDISHRLPRAFLQRIVELAKTHNTQIDFVYLPAYTYLPEQQPLYSEPYQQWGHLHLPPDSLRRQLPFQMDTHHLNGKGATAYTQWLREEIVWDE